MLALALPFRWGAPLDEGGSLGPLSAPCADGFRALLTFCPQTAHKLLILFDHFYGMMGPQSGRQAANHRGGKAR